MRQGELRALTGARGITAWFVVLFHIHGSIAGLPLAIDRLLAKGYLAVDFFFLLSGFVIRLSWGDRLHAERGAATGPFLRKRFARVWPLHAAVLASTVILAALLAATGRADPVAFPMAQLPLQILLLQNWGFTDQLAWNVPSWSISAEFAAYLLFPVLAIAVDWRRLSTTMLLALAGALVIALFLAMRETPLLGVDVPRFGLVRCLCEFTGGAIVCILWQRRTATGTVAATGAAAMLASLWVAGAPETLVVPGLFACALFLLAGMGPNHPISGTVPHRLGEISYATYLCHYPLWIAFKLVFVRDAADVPASVILAYLAGVLTASAILHRWIERPAQRRIAG